MRVAIVIPARYASSRLPRKMLLSETGMPLIQHTYLKALQSQLASRVIIATDDQRIADVATSFDAEVVMTDPTHPTGTDRLAEVATRYLHDVDLVVNVQGDEPECNPDDIDRLIRLFQATECAMATVVCPFPKDVIEGPGSPKDPNCVKAVLGIDIPKTHLGHSLDTPKTHLGHSLNSPLGHEVLYFSRSLIPFPRESAGQIVQSSDYYMHCGLYAYTPEFLKTYVKLPQSRAEKMEKLEQLRILENGYKIVAVTVEKTTPGIDTQEDYDAFVQRCLNEKQKVRVPEAL